MRGSSRLGVGLGGGIVDRLGQPVDLGPQAVDDERTEFHPDLLLDVEGGIDRLRHRRLLGQGDQHDPAAGFVAEEGQDLIGLIPDRSAGSRVGHAGRCGQQRQRMPRCRCVDHDQIGRTRLLELADLAQGHQVPQAGGGRNHHLHRPGSAEGPDDRTHAGAIEVVGQSFVGAQLHDLERAGIVGQQTLGGPSGFGADRTQPEGFQVAVALQLDEKNVTSASGGREGDDSPYRCLSDPTLTGHDEDIGCG